MVSERCKLTVKAALKKQELHFVVVDLGEVDVMEDLTPAQLKQLDADIRESGLELMDNKKAILIEKIKEIKCHAEFRKVLR